MNQDFQIRHESKHYRPCNQYKHRFHYSHHRSLLGGRSVKQGTFVWNSMERCGFTMAPIWSSPLATQWSKYRNCFFNFFLQLNMTVSFSLPYSIFCVSQIALFYMDFGTLCTVIMTPRPLSFIFFWMFMMSFEIERRKVFA